VIPSILLDAGGGTKWRYASSGGAKPMGRSEGLAIASFDMFTEGFFSSDKSKTSQAERLRAIRADELQSAMQVTIDNPLLGVEGRVKLLNNLGILVSESKAFVGQNRVGGFAEFLCEHKTTVDASEVLTNVLVHLGTLWPARLKLEGVDLGDVWQHSKVSGGLVPFHKLSQWLTYSLLEPLEWTGIQVVGVEKLTGLAEYRNGGLFVDAKVIVPRKESAFSHEFKVSDEFVVEWRALTVALLDELADTIRIDMHRSAEELPLAKVLQGGTWAAGREIAAKTRSEGGPPFKIISDGTVF
jgi:hypothetical protein